MRMNVVSIWGSPRLGELVTREPSTVVGRLLRTGRDLYEAEDEMSIRLKVWIGVGAVLAIAAGVTAAFVVGSDDGGQSNTIIAGAGAEVAEEVAANPGGGASAVARVLVGGPSAFPAGPAADLELPTDGPALVWTAVDGPAGLDQLTWNGDQFVALGGTFNGTPGVSLWTSPDGRSWSPIDLGVSTGRNSGVDQFSLVGDRGIAIVTTWPENPEQFTYSSSPPQPSHRALTTNDGGATWTEGALPIEVIDTGSPYLDAFSYPQGVAAGQSGFVVVISNQVHPNIERLLVDRGLITEDELQMIEGMGWGGDGSGAIVDVEIDLSDGRHLTFDSIDLGAGGVLLDHQMGSASVLFSADGTSFERVDELAGVEGHEIISFDGGFAMNGYGENGPVVVTSADGRTWDVMSQTDQAQLIGADGGRLIAHRYAPNGPEFVESTDGGRTWVDAQIAPIGGSGFQANEFEIGPAGLVGVGHAEHNPFEGMDLPDHVVEHDGFTVTQPFGAPGPTTITDSSGAVVATYDEAGYSAITPDDIPIQPDEDGVTFLDPDTLELIVTIPHEKFDEAHQPIEEIMNDLGPEMTEPEMVIVFSADGQAWHGQTVSDAFGFEGYARVAVGDDVVLAWVEDHMGGGPGPSATLFVGMPAT